MKSNYPWLHKNQRQEQDSRTKEIERLQKQLMTLGGQPLSTQLGKSQEFFTGLGEDNQLQPNRPTHLLMTNQGEKTVHEGEGVGVGPNGKLQVTPASQVGGQQALAQQEQQRNIQGFQTGLFDVSGQKITADDPATGVGVNESGKQLTGEFSSSNPAPRQIQTPPFSINTSGHTAPPTTRPVSYTHLTLPTIYSV